MNSRFYAVAPVFSAEDGFAITIYGSPKQCGTCGSTRAQLRQTSIPYYRFWQCVNTKLCSIRASKVEHRSILGV